MKTLPEWSHLNLSEEVLITSQYLFCISRSERVYLTIEALTFSICETATRQLWLFPVGSFLSSYLLFPLLLLFSYFLCCFLYLLSSLFFLFLFSVLPLFFQFAQFIPYLVFLPFLLLPPPLPRSLTSLHSVKYSRSMMHCYCTGDWTGGFVA